MVIEELDRAIAVSAAVRRRRRLQPAGGRGDKIFPPTYPALAGDGRNAPPRHVYERRRGDTGERECVLIDSVQSQANRMEESLTAAILEGVPVPHLRVDFGGHNLGGLTSITSLEAPHRLFDAIFRDSALDGVPFMRSPLGVAIQTATLADASAILTASPSALIFGIWNSTGEGGGLGAKFARSLTSEIVGIDVPVDEVPQRDGSTDVRTAGRRTGSRIDPLGILRKVEVYKTKGSGWDTDPGRLPDTKTDKPKKARPSEINHGNIPPSILPLGITMDYAEHVIVLSLAGMRRLRFDGPARNEAARTYLAALALLAVLEQDRAGYALRSRCDLVPEGPSPFELVHADGTTEPLELALEDVRSLYAAAFERALQVGIAFPTEPIVLTPQPKLVEIIRRSRELALEGEGGEEASDANVGD